MYSIEKDTHGDKLAFTARPGDKLGRWQSEVASGQRQAMSVEHAMTAREALALARLDGTYSLRQAYAAGADGRVIPCEGMRAVVRDRDETFIPRGMVSPDYTLRQPADVLETFIGDSPLITTIAGLASLDIYAQVALDPIEVQAKGGPDQVKGNLTFLLNFAGIRTDRIGISLTRAVCENTMTHSTLGLTRIRHTEAGERKMSRMAELHREAIAARAEEERRYNAMARTDLSENAAHEMLALIFPGESKRTIERRDTAMARFTGAGVGADLAGRTAWGLYQAVTEDLRDRAGQGDGNVDAWLWNELSDGAADVRERALQPLLVLAGV